MRTFSSPSRIEQINPHLWDKSIQIIRSETVLSRLPIHNLSKLGKVNIEIKRKTNGGETELLWKVSYNEGYGQPRQLAYKIDTLLVNRKIDEGGRPVPKLICLGSLSDICRSFNLAESGANLKGLKAALLQNASAFITAKLSYQGRDGEKRRLEAGFTRYSVIFTGQQLPDGTRADAVYLALNDPYREVLCHAPVRPLNYEYLKKLTPAAQRFYEIVSYRIFAALKHRLSEAKHRYSDYCTYSAQPRYFDYDHVKKQMYKIHQPHLMAGYLSRVRFEQIEDGEGQADWQMIYTPGPRALHEYLQFTRKNPSMDIAGDEVQPLSSKGCRRQIRPTSARQEDEQQQSQGVAVDNDLIDSVLLKALTSRGVIEDQAKILLRNLKEGQQALSQLAWGDYVINHSQIPFHNPAGFYVHLIKHNVAVPNSFKTPVANATKGANLSAEGDGCQAFTPEQCTAYQQYQAKEIDRFIEENLSAEERQVLRENVWKQLITEYPEIPQWPQVVAEHTLRYSMRSELKGKVPLRDIATFCSSENISQI